MSRRPYACSCASRFVSHESLEPRVVLAACFPSQVDLGTAAGFQFVPVALPLDEGLSTSLPARGTAGIDPSVTGETGTVANLDKPSEPPISTPISNGVSGGPGQHGGPDGHEPPTVAITSPADGTQVVGGGTL